MISAELIELIEMHAANLTKDVTKDVMTDARTRGFRTVPVQDLEQRVSELLHHLGNWIGDPKAEKVRAEFIAWGKLRFAQGIPLSEVVCSVIILKRHLRRYISDHGLVDASFPRVERDYVLPMHLQSLQELNATVSDFFDDALYSLVIGFETAQAGR